MRTARTVTCSARKRGLVYTDGTTSDEIAIDEEQSIYEFNFEPTKLVDRIDITFVDATHTHATRSNMLTLAELEITGHVPADSDKAALQAAVTAAEQIDTSIYTDETVAVFEEALNEAKAVLANVDVKQDVVDAADGEAAGSPGGIGAQGWRVCLRI